MKPPQHIKRYGFVFLLMICTAVRSTPISDRLHRLHRDIILLNLVNGLYLSETQARTIIQKVEEAQSVRESFLQKIESEEKIFTRLLESLKEILLRGESIPEDLASRIHRIKQVQHTLEDNRGEQLLALERDVENCLTSNQRIVVEDYQPCTIPPAEGRIGQSVETAAEGAAQLLTRIRRMDGYVFRTTKEMIIDVYIDRIERMAGILDPERRAIWKEKIDVLLETARSLPDQEFLVRKGEMARQFLPEVVEHRTIRRKNQLGRTGRFFLDPAMADLLKARFNIAS